MFRPVSAMAALSAAALFTLPCVAEDAPEAPAPEAPAPEAPAPEAAAAEAPAPEEADPAVIVIGGKPAVLRSELDARVKEMLARSPFADAGEEFLAMMRPNVARQLAMQRVLLDEAKARGIEVTAEDRAAAFEEFGITNLAEVAKEAGVPLERVEKDFSEGLLCRKLIESAVPAPELTDEQVRARFDEIVAAHPEAAHMDETVRASHILVRVDKDASEEEVAAVPVADAPEGETSDHPIFSFPGGPNVGDCWHDILEEADFRAPAAALRPLVEKHLLAGGFLRGSPEVRDARTDTVLDMVGRTLDLPLTAPDGTVFRLRDVAREDRASEWQFDFSSRDCAATTAALRDVLAKHWGGEPEGSDHRVFLDSLGGWNKPLPRGFFTGFLDLAFRVGGRYYVVDWKSNSLRRREAAFSHAGLRAEMTAHAYFLQYLIYAAVLHRHLADSLPDYRWETHFGGVRYVFLRGAAIGREAVWSDRPSEALLEDFGAALGLPRKGAHA